MRIRAKAVETVFIPQKIEPFARQRFISAGKEYDVHAIAVLKDGVPFFQFVDDLGYPAWQPSIFFDMTDKSVPPDWQCNCLQGNEGESAFLLGPPFLVSDAASYEKMIELDADQVDRFWKRVDSLSNG